MILKILNGKRKLIKWGGFLMVEMSNLLNCAYQNHFAVMAINIESFDIVRALAKSAAVFNTPIIIQTTEAAVEELEISNIVHLINYYEKYFQIPISLHLDHATNLEIIINCIRAGYKSVMIDASNRTEKDNILITKEVVEYAKSVGAWVEAEMGIVGKNGENDLKSELESCCRFVEETNVDSLAISVGNSHGGRSKIRRIDFDLLKKINDRLKMPLVLHGSSGVINEDLTKAVEYGITKINIETELRVLQRDALMM